MLITAKEWRVFYYDRFEPTIFKIDSEIRELCPKQYITILFFANF